MDPIYNLTEVRRILRRGIEAGHWTMEQLDQPSKGYKALCEEMKRHKVVELRSFPVPPYRNPLRDETPESTERVEVVSPRDFGPAPNPKPSEPSEPEELDGVTIYSNSPDLFF